jgi:hypothetical protein
MNRQMVVALVALLMAACARDPKDGPGAAPADSTASRPDVGVKGPSDALDACAVTSCTFVSRGASIRDMVTVSVMVVTSPSDAAQRSTEQMKQGATSLGLNAKPIDLPGLGDAAYWVNLGSASRSAVAINVKQGSRRWLTVGESSSGQSVDETVARLTTIAKSALGKL